MAKIMVQVHKVVDNKCIPSRMLAKFDEDNAPFDIKNKNEMLRWLRINYLNVKSKDGLPLRYRIYLMGGQKGKPKSAGFQMLFPGFDSKGNKYPLLIYGDISIKRKRR